MGDVENFADHPKSVSELRSDKSDSAADWTPRDALIDMLREIDSGELDCDAMVILFRPRSQKPGRVCVASYRNATPDPYTALGMLTSVTGRLILDNQM